MTEKEAWALIDNIPQIDTIWISDDKTREQKYKEALQSCNPVQLVGIIKNIYIRKSKEYPKAKRIQPLMKDTLRLQKKLYMQSLPLL